MAFEIASNYGFPSHRLTWKIIVLLERGFAHFHLSWWEAIPEKYGVILSFGTPSAGLRIWIRVGSRGIFEKPPIRRGGLSFFLDAWRRVLPLGSWELSS